MLRHNQQIISLGVELHAHHLIVIHEIDSSHSHGYSSRHPHIRLLKANALAEFCNQNNIFGIIGKFHLDELVVIPQDNGCQAGLPYILIVCNGRFFHNSLFGRHKQEMVFLIFLNGDHRGNFFSRLQMQQVDNGGSPGCPAGFRNLIDFKPVHLSRVGKEHEIMMGSGHQQLFNVIILNGLHSLDSLASTALAAEIVHGHSLDVSQLGHSNDHVLPGDQILHGKVKFIVSDGSSSVIPVFVGNCQNLFSDDSQQSLPVRQDLPVFLDPDLQFMELGFQLGPFQTCESPQTHIHNGLSLGIGKSEFPDEIFFCLLGVGGSPDDLDDSVDMIQSFQQTLQNMRPLLRFVEVVSGSSCHHIFLMPQIQLQHIQKIQNFRLLIHQSQHNHPEGILQLGMLVELIQDHIGVGVPAQLDTDAHTLPVGMIVNGGNSVDLLFSHQLRHFFNQAGFIYQIGKLCDNDLALAVGQSLDICHRPHPDLSPSGAVGLLDAPGSQNLRSGGKIRSLDNFQHFFHGGIAVILHKIIYNLHHSGDNLPQIMGRYISSHAHGDAGCTVDQQIGISGRKHRRLFFRVVKVWNKIHGILVDVRQHFHGNLA